MDLPISLTDGKSDMNTVIAKEQDEFAYVDREHFTSEAFKIEIGNIPKYFGFAECKKLLKNKLKLNPHKIKHIPNVGKIYITFKNDDDKKKALEVLDKYEYKRCVFAAKIAKPKADAMATKRTADEPGVGESTDVKKSKIATDEVPSMTPAELIVASVTKWHDIPYEEQLNRKYSQMKNFLCTVRSRMGKLNLDNEVFVWVMKHRAEHGGMCCPLHPILPSPAIVKYRNKSEYTAGLNTAGEKTVGYRLGKYRDKTCAVEQTNDITILPDNMKTIANEFQDYIRTSNKGTYDPQSYEGHWRQLTVRTTLSGEVMATVITCKKDSNEKEEKDELKEYFQSENRSGIVSTLLYQHVPTHRASGTEIEAPEILFGNRYIVEQLLGLQFQISPEAFFQCNTLAAEVLYAHIGKMLKPDFVSSTQNSHDNIKIENSTDTTDNSGTSCEKKVILFDVCCGTGTIGLTLASTVEQVVGIELCEQAVQDAKKNAELNGIKNVEFHCGKAEDLMPTLVRKYSSNSNNEIVAVVDPPRPGLHNKVIQCLRKCPVLKKIIYVSCNPNSAINNFIDLCKPASKRMSGLPFLPYCAQPVDLFPQTPHCELIVYFQRTTGKQRCDDLTTTENPKEPSNEIKTEIQECEKNETQTTHSLNETHVNNK